MTLLQGDVAPVHLVTSDVGAAPADARALDATGALAPGLAAWAAAIAVVIGLVAVGTLAYGWWRVRRSPMDRALAALCVRARLWRRSDRRALRTLATLTGVNHAGALLLSPSALRAALLAHGAQIGEATSARLRRRVVDAA